VIIYDYHKVSRAIRTIAVLLRLATHDRRCDVRMWCICELDIWSR